MHIKLIYNEINNLPLYTTLNENLMKLQVFLQGLINDPEKELTEKELTDFNGTLKEIKDTLESFDGQPQRKKQNTDVKGGKKSKKYQKKYGGKKSKKQRKSRRTKRKHQN